MSFFSPLVKIVNCLKSVLKTQFGCPAAAKTVVNLYKLVSIKIFTLLRCPTGETPPIV